ncbi:MAG: DUF4177 domain-containing protein [Clostridia bacterium]|nr:DUF4177 domain-containing protein [Clostridia bacterium]
MWECKCGGVNSDSSRFCQSCGSSRSISVYSKEKKAAEFKRHEDAREQRIHQEQQRILNSKIDNLKDVGYDGYWEYKVVDLLDNKGIVDTYKIAETLNELGLQGWRLKCAYTNEVGKNVSTVGVGALAGGVNSTVDQNILILERFVKI